MTKKRRTLGKFPPQHTFFLNPYANERFTRCPQCRQRTRIRKFPFAVHIDPDVHMLLNASGPYCPFCDLIILHQDKVESLLALSFEQRMPQFIGNDYVVIGTVERAQWRKSSTQGGSVRDLIDNLQDFKKVVSFEVRYGWVRDGDENDRRNNEPK